MRLGMAFRTETQSGAPRGDTNTEGGTPVTTATSTAATVAAAATASTSLAHTHTTRTCRVAVRPPRDELRVEVAPCAVGRDARRRAALPAPHRRPAVAHEVREHARGGRRPGAAVLRGAQVQRRQRQAWVGCGRGWREGMGRGGGELSVPGQDGWDMKADGRGTGMSIVQAQVGRLRAQQGATLQARQAPS